MPSRRTLIPAKHLFNGFKRQQRPMRSQAFARTMATEAPLPPSPGSPDTTLSQTYVEAHLDSAATKHVLRDEVAVPPPASSSSKISIPAPFQPQRNPFLTTATCTLHSFPSLEPVSFATYPSTHILVPLRKDILHRAVIFEGDATRLGTASTKWRSEVHGSGRKIRPQKGTGHARLGDKKSPMLRGGGVAFGPKPRDFSTDLPKKLYDQAWRMALSYRYSKGELILLDGKAEIDEGSVHPDSQERWLKDMLRYNRMGHGNGRTLFVTTTRREGLYSALEAGKKGREALAKDLEDVDVKDLLELGRLVMERKALEHLFRAHQSDLVPSERLGARESRRPDESVAAA